MSYEKRVYDVNAIYDHYARTGLSNREIWRRYVWPRYAISERTFYSLLKSASAVSVPRASMQREGLLFPEWEDERPERGLDFFREIDH